MISILLENLEHYGVVDAPNLAAELKANAISSMFYRDVEPIVPRAIYNHLCEYRQGPKRVLDHLTISQIEDLLLIGSTMGVSYIIQDGHLYYKKEIR